MIAIGKLAYEICDLRKGFGWNVLSPLKSCADSVESAQRSFDYTMFVLEGLYWMRHS